jgi:hypothetical protein
VGIQICGWHEPGTIFGDWTVAQIRPWLLEVVGICGEERAMLFHRTAERWYAQPSR